MSPILSDGSSDAAEDGPSSEGTPAEKPPESQTGELQPAETDSVTGGAEPAVTFLQPAETDSIEHSADSGDSGASGASGASGEAAGDDDGGSAQ